MWIFLIILLICLLGTDIGKAILFLYVVYIIYKLIAISS